jgi:hypothetical protein
MGQRFSDRHEVTAEKINTINGLKRHLCSQAVSVDKKGNPKNIYPENCAGCEVGCAYGKKLINILESQGYDFSRFKPEKAPNYIREVGYFKNTLTLRDSIRGRRKGY